MPINARRANGTASKSQLPITVYGGRARARQTRGGQTTPPGLLIAPNQSCWGTASKCQLPVTAYTAQEGCTATQGGCPRET